MLGSYWTVGSCCSRGVFVLYGLEKNCLRKLVGFLDPRLLYLDLVLKLVLFISSVFISFEKAWIKHESKNFKRKAGA